MKGEEAKLTPKQEKAIAALIACPTIKEAAESAGIGETTIFRYLQDAAFKEAYRAARRAAVDQATTTLQQATAEAVQTLRGALTCGKAEVQVRAAVAILQAAYKSIEIEDVEDRIARLEAALGGQGES